MPYWKELEEIIDRLGGYGVPFTVSTIRDHLSIQKGQNPDEASKYIKSLVEASVNENSRTNGIPIRDPGTRTTHSVWRYFEINEENLDKICVTLFNDIVAKAVRMYGKILRRIGRQSSNPNVKDRCEWRVRGAELALEGMRHTLGVNGQGEKVTF